MSTSVGLTVWPDHDFVPLVKSRTSDASPMPRPCFPALPAVELMMPLPFQLPLFRPCATRPVKSLYDAPPHVPSVPLVTIMSLFVRSSCAVVGTLSDPTLL